MERNSNCDVKSDIFDLDCTLLPMDQEKFIYSYFSRLTGRLAQLGYEKDEVKKHIWNGTMAMERNDGILTNEQIFWNYFTNAYGGETLKHQTVFEEFYRTDFQLVKEVCEVNPASRQVVDILKGKGYPLILATNPLFPAIATQSRVRWAGLQPEDFIHITTYENASYAKPNPSYYQEILDKLDLRAEECLMVGNDAKEDMAAEQVGMRVFLLTNLLINTDKLDISRYPQGGFPELLAYIEKLEKEN